MNSFNQVETMDIDQEDSLANLETEKHLLKQQIRELENALAKSKKFHRKFADDVIESEDIRNREFERVKKELIAINKQQIIQIRELTKDKSFYENTCNELMKEKEMSSNADNLSQSTPVLKSFVPTNSSTTDKLKLTTRCQSSFNDSKFKMLRNASNLKISTKLFEDNKKLKEKVSKLTRSNATLRLQVKQLENFKSKFQIKKQQQVVDQQKLESLIDSTTRTNGETFNKSVLSQLDKLYNRVQPIESILEHL